MLLFAFKSFEGKTTQVQSMIAQDIDNADTVQPGMSFEPLASKYSSFLSTLNAGKSGKVNQVRPGKGGNRPRGSEFRRVSGSFR